MEELFLLKAISTMQIILITVIVLGFSYAIYRDFKKVKENLISYTLELINKGENRETIIFNLMTHYKLSIRKANQVYEDVELSGLIDKLKDGYYEN